MVDNSNGTVLVYAYNPTSTVTQTAQLWSATNASNGAPAGNEISDVVDNTNGTVLIYAYNPSSTVTLTAQLWSADESGERGARRQRGLGGRRQHRRHVDPLRLQPVQHGDADRDLL